MRADMYVETVLKKCEIFSSCALWSREPSVRPRAWLNNFDDDDKPIAAVLLDHFVYFSSLATDQLLIASMRQVSSIVRRYRGVADHDKFLNEVVFTPVLGEDPNPTDSGQLFCRKVRQILGFNDDRFVSLEKAYELSRTGVPVIFLDDFVGSGDQMVSTWSRELKNGASFENLAKQQHIDATYVALVATEYGRNRLEKELPNLRLVVSHVLDKSHSVFSVPSNPLTPDIENINVKIEHLIQKYLPRLTFPAYLNSVDGKKYGYSELGLLLAFEHSVPDATLPLLWASGSNGWTPLARRA